MLRAPSPVDDGARVRLRSLGGARRARPASVPDEGWGGPDEVEVDPEPDPALEPDPGDGARVGWPDAPPGTPAARLRLPAPEPGRDRDAWWDNEDDEPTPRARGSAWDPPERGTQARRWAERWLPASWAGARWDPGRTGALALAAVAAVAAVVAAVGVWADRPVPEPVPALPLVAGAPAAPSLPGALPAAPSADAGPIVVSVSGRVQRPGLVRLAPGSRVGDAVDAAGGATPDADLTGLNLAARIADGEQVVVGVPTPVTPPGGGAGATPAAGGGGAGGGAAGGAPGGRVDLNTATLEQLDQLPGVGPVTAQRILEWRSQNGRFGAVDQLQEVSGIGEARFATLRDLVTV
jgi:competence protein ComEA